jgi:hypothetical protein
VGEELGEALGEPVASPSVVPAEGPEVTVTVAAGLTSLVGPDELQAAAVKVSRVRMRSAVLGITRWYTRADGVFQVTSRRIVVSTAASATTAI